jgi:hypothetical protein
VLLGDAAGSLDPISGGGMAQALLTAELLAGEGAMGIRFKKHHRPSRASGSDPRTVLEMVRQGALDDLSPRGVAAVSTMLDQLGLPRLLRLLVAGSIPPLWYEIALLHYRGSFQSRWMWLPLADLPLELAGGALAGASDTRTNRTLFRALSWGTVVLGAFGTLMHVRGVRRQMGGLYSWRYNVMTGPPIVAPPQVALFGLIGVLSTSEATTQAMVHRLRRLEVAAQLLLAVEAGDSHYQNYYANPVQYVPVLLAPALPVAQATAEVSGIPIRRAGQRLGVVLAAAATLAGLVGFGFHVKNVRSRSGGFSWQNLFYGAPLVAPLQLSGQGLLGLLAAYFDRRRR